jgi:predicted MPP superfamily phosphohydrolase
MRPWVQFLVFIAVFSAVTGGIHLYLWARLVRAPQLPPGATRALTIAIALGAVLLPVALVLGRSVPRALGVVLSWAAFTWLGFVILAFFSTLAAELLRVGVTLVDAARGAPADPARRTLLARLFAAGIASLTAGAGAAGLASALGAVAVRRVRIGLPRWPEALRGYKIAQLTDVHVGPTIGGEWLAGIVDKTNALEPDLVVITGDLVDGTVEDLREHVAPLARLSARHGVYFVTGNHEYYSGVEEWLEELARLGVRTLRNERVAIGDDAGGFDLAGVDDWSASRHGRGHGADLDRALEGRDDSREVVLLAHQPKQAPAAAKKGVGLQLSGHTHGGQIFPWGLFVRIDQPFVAGLDRLDDLLVYTSCGTGYWGPPMRLGAPAEIALLEIDRG